MHFHSPQRRVNYQTLKLNNDNIERVSQFNLLAVILASSLKWDKHVAHVSIKKSGVIGVLHRLKHNFSREVLNNDQIAKCKQRLVFYITYTIDLYGLHNIKFVVLSWIYFLILYNYICS